MNINFKKKNIFQLALLLQGIASFLALTVYAYSGKFTRLIADDYYHSYLLQSGESLWQISVKKYLYTSNRYTNMYFFAFGEWIGNQWLSAFLIFLWLLGMIWLLLELSKLVGMQLSRWTIFTISALLIFLSILQAPNLYQTIYWIPGMVTYFAPLVFFIFLLAGIFAFLRHPRGKTHLLLAALLSLVAAFLIGGLSETVGALHITILFFTMLAFWIWGEKDKPKNALILLGAALLGGFISLAVMALSPANAIRSTIAPITIPVFIQRIITFPFGFILDTLKTLPLPSFFTVFVAFLIFSGNPKFSPLRGELEGGRRRILLWALALTPLLIYALIAASFAPSAYALSYPDARVRFPARVVMTSALFIEGALLGMLFASKRRVLTALLLVAAAIYPLRGAWQAYQTLPKYQAYADAWDTREAYILSKKESGIMEIAVPPMDGMAGIKEFDIDPNHWVNRGAADYYGVDAISVHSSDLSYDE